MNDEGKTREQLILELKELRQRLSEAGSLNDTKRLDANKCDHGVAESDPAESEANYRSLFEYSLDAVFLTVPDGSVRAANPAACKMFGMTEEEICRAGRQGLVDPSDPRHAAALEERARAGKLHCELRYVRKDGSKFLAEVSSVILKGGRKSFVILRDITERKLAEDALRESERKYRSFFENSFDAIFLTVPEKGGVILAASPEACRMFDYTEEEFCKLGRSGIVDTTDSRCQQFLEQRSLRGKARGEMVHIRKDGTKFPTDVSSTVFKDKDGRNLCITIIRDISESKRNEQDLRKSEVRYRLLAENATDVIWTVGMDMRLTYVSPSVTRLLGFTAEEAMARTMQQAYTPAAFEKAMKIFAEEMALESAGHGDPNRSRILELELVRKDGNTVLVEGNFSFLRDSAGKAISLLSIVRDISERMRDEQALRKSEEHYRSLFENMLDGFAYCKMIFENEQPVDFEYIAVNSAFEELTGMKNVIGKKVTEAIPGIREFNPELFEISGRVAMTGRPERFETYVSELGIWFVISVYSLEKGSFVAIFDNTSDRKKAEAALRVANEELEKRVEERTFELKAKTVNLEEVNTALRVLLDRREEDRKEFEEAIAGNLKSLIVPYIEKLQRTQLSANQATYLSILQSHLQEIESRFLKKLSLQHMGLTPTEIQVAALIRDGKTSKDIAEALHVSEKAVEFHRNNIRRKLNITNKKENLRSHLLALS